MRVYVYLYIGLCEDTCAYVQVQVCLHDGMCEGTCAYVQVHMCLYVGMCEGTCVYVQVHVYMHVWRAEADVRNLSYCSSALFFEAGPLNQFLRSHASLSIQLALRIPCLSFPRLELQTCPPKIYLGSEAPNSCLLGAKHFNSSTISPILKELLLNLH